MKGGCWSIRCSRSPSLYVLGVYQLPSHQQPSSGRGPGAELVMGSTVFGFRVFTILMLGNRYLIYQIDWRTGCLLASNMHLIVYLFSNGNTFDRAVLPWINTYRRHLLSPKSHTILSYCRQKQYVKWVVYREFIFHSRWEVPRWPTVFLNPFDGHVTIPWGHRRGFMNGSEAIQLTLVGNMTVTT